MHPATHVGDPRNEPYLRVGRQRDHVRRATQSSTTRRAWASTVPRTRTVMSMKLISMNESGASDAQLRCPDGEALTGSSAGVEVGLIPISGEYWTLHRRNRLALLPCVRAMAATETPGCRHSRTNVRFASALYVRRPPFGEARTTRPSTVSATRSDMVST